ncbi:uncharacterized protein LOC133206131 [Saccostrea echinata]|uniref:uncharacterized protein LOC133206131 n=1 Tax=Saccostrea echinata TaxID=191078 RepID=UPI002A7F4A29|nr:uncharacterized protein LOC133206131 [Saccostrea echinata]
MDTNLTDDVKVRLGAENKVTLTDGIGIQQVNVRVPKCDPDELLPGCYEKDGAETLSSKFNLHRQYSLPFQETFAQKPEDCDIILPNIFEEEAPENSCTKPKVSISKKEIVIDQNSPTQIDITWSIKNTKLGVSYMYELEIMTNTEWLPLTEKKAPVIRIYKTDFSVSLCKLKWDLRKGDAVWHVRIRSRDSQMAYDWSDSIKILICGIRNEVHFDPNDKAGSILY